MRHLLLLLLLFGIVLSTPLTLQSQTTVIRTPPQWDGLLHTNCDETKAGLCPDPFNRQNYEGVYIGHDEPALLFYSNKKGSGRSSFYTLRIPKEPPTKPTQDGTGGVYNFQLHIAFWFGMALCDNQSAPNPDPRGTCQPGTDDNIFDNPNPAAEDYIGKHPGAAFLELQFYPPGWIASPGLVSDTEWLAALNIFSYSLNMNTGQQNNLACLHTVGLEPHNTAFITKNGIPLAPPNPLGIPFGVSRYDLDNVLTMFGGDVVKVSIFDTPDGLKVVLEDVTTGHSGSMVAGIAQGFGQVNFEPKASTCSVTPYAFHPMYDTSSEHTRVPWTQHTYNVSFSDEIGHFEFCDGFNSSLQCTVPGVDEVRVDSDDFPCASPAFFGLPSSFIQITGCYGSDLDFDGTSYRLSWPGTNPVTDVSHHPEPIRFSSAQFQPPGNRALDDYDRVAFEANLPAISCCVNPPRGALFYPIFSTATVGGQCMWQFGGPSIPGTTNNFGGNSTAQYGALLNTAYPGVGGPSFRVNNFRRILDSNPCEVNPTALIISQINELMTLLKGFNLDFSTYADLTFKLQGALDGLNSNQPGNACSPLASFLFEVNRLSGKQLKVSEAYQLTSRVSHIKSELACP